MNFRTTLVLLALVVVVGLALLIVNHSQNAPSVDSAGGRLVALEAGDVAKVQVLAADGKRLVLEKASGAWRMVEPVAAAADAFAVEGLLRGLVDLNSRGQVKLSGDNASAAGMDRPRYQVEIQGAGGKVAKYKVGNRMTIGNNVYLQLDGETIVHVVGGDVYDQLDKPFASYRQSKLVSASSSDIRQIEITRPVSKLVLQKNGRDWQVIEPEILPAEASEVSKLTMAIAGLNATEFVSEADIPELLRPNNDPQLTVWFSTQAPSTQPTTRPAGITLCFGGFDSVLKKNIYASIADASIADARISDPPTLVKVGATAITAFDKKPLDLRSRSLLNIDPAEVHRIAIITEKPATTQPTNRDEVVIERKKQVLELGPDMPTTRPTTAPTAPALPPSDWVLKSAGDADASQMAVASLLKKFRPLRVDQYVPGPLPSTLPTTRYTVEIAVRKAGGSEAAVHQIRLLEPGNGQPILGQYKGLVFELGSTFVQDLVRDFSNQPETPAAGDESSVD